MEQKPDLRRQLFSRQQIADLTGIDDSTLNYWMREGVLRADSGGGGKGQHRRFRFAEVNLALIFNQLRTFGISMPSLRQLSERFHAALDFMEAAGIDPRDDGAVSNLLMIRRSIASRGYFPVFFRANDRADFKRGAPWILEMERFSDEYGTHEEVRLDWQQAVDYYRAIPDLYGRAPDANETYPVEVVGSIAAVDIDLYSQHDPYWYAATALNLRFPSDDFRTSPTYFYRGENGDWLISAGDPDQSIVSFIGVDIEHLSALTWGGR